MAAGALNCPLAATIVALYSNDMGWSSARLVPRFDDPTGIPPIPLKLIMVGLLYTLPSAIVPSWQERHIIDDPSGCPGTAFMVELEYNV